MAMSSNSHEIGPRYPIDVKSDRCDGAERDHRDSLKCQTTGRTMTAAHHSIAEKRCGDSEENPSRIGTDEPHFCGRDDDNGTEENQPGR